MGSEGLELTNEKISTTVETTVPRPFRGGPLLTRFCQGCLSILAQAAEHSLAFLALCWERAQGRLDDLRTMCGSCELKTWGEQKISRGDNGECVLMVEEVATRRGKGHDCES